MFSTSIFYSFLIKLFQILHLAKGLTCDLCCQPQCLWFSHGRWNKIYWKGLYLLSFDFFAALIVSLFSITAKHWLLSPVKRDIRLGLYRILHCFSVCKCCINRSYVKIGWFLVLRLPRHDFHTRFSHNFKTKAGP